MSDGKCFCDGQECLALGMWGKVSCGECVKPKRTIESLRSNQKRLISLYDSGELTTEALKELACEMRKAVG